MAHRNRIREIVESGDRAVGAKVYSFNETMIEMLGRIDMDYAWMEIEHHGPSSSDSDALESFARAADAAGIEILVKHPARNVESDFNKIHKLLESGIRNIVFTQVENAEQVRELVKATRFTYEGEVGGRYSGNGRLRHIIGKHEGYHQEEDDNVFVGVIIEQSEAAENIEEIVQVPKLGFAMIGSGGLATSLGHPGNLTHPDCVEAERKILSAIDEAGLPMGFTLHNVSEFEAGVERGLGFAQRENVEYPNIQLVQVGVDFAIFREELTRRLDALEPQL